MSTIPQKVSWAECAPGLILYTFTTPAGPHVSFEIHSFEINAKDEDGLATYHKDAPDGIEYGWLWKEDIQRGHYYLSAADAILAVPKFVAEQVAQTERRLKAFRTKLLAAEAWAKEQMNPRSSE